MSHAVVGRATRRELVLSAVAATAIGCAPGVDASAAALPASSDADVLTRSLRVEYLLASVYRRALASGALRPAVTRRVSDQLAQELDHAAALRRELIRLGAPLPPAPGDLVAAQDALAAHHVQTNLNALRTQDDWLKLLVGVETVAEGIYFEAIGRLTDPALVRKSLEIMGCEAQHWTVLSGIRHHGDVTMSVPYAFVQGPA